MAYYGQHKNTKYSVAKYFLQEKSLFSLEDICVDYNKSICNHASL